MIIRSIMKKLLFLAGLVLLLCMPATVQAASANAVASAKQVTGGSWVSDSSGRKYQLADGSYAKNTWLQISGSIYRFNSRGICRTGWFTWKKNSYYASKTGKLYVKRWLRQEDGQYYFLSTGVCAKSMWITWKDKKYYVSKSGRMVAGRMLTLKKKTYYFNKSGVRLQSIWVTKDGQRYYFNRKGVRLENKWLRSGGRYYYFGSDGALMTNSWVGKYYVGEDGARMTDCVVDGYYLNETGEKTIQIADVRYIFLGDSRIDGMKAAVTSGDVAYISSNGMGYEWLNEKAGTILGYYLAVNPQVKVVLALGINDLGNSSQYIAYYRNLIQSYPQTGFHILSVNPVDEEKEKENGYTIKNSSIRSFNKKMKAAFGSPVYVNTYSYLNKRKFNSWDGVHYTADVYVDLFNYIVSVI